MKTQDVIDPDFKQEPVMLIKDEKKLQVMGNPVHYPIFMSLREGYKTVNEIEEFYNIFIEKQAKKKGGRSKKEIEEYVEQNKRSGKSLYRYIQLLIKAGFVAVIGKRVAIDKPMTEKLFARTAKFFFVDAYYAKTICKEPACFESLAKLLSLIYNTNQIESGILEEFSRQMIESSKKITTILFEKKQKEFVEIVENLSLEEVGDVIQIISIIELIKESDKHSKLLKKLKE